jgi:hypothetical protein
MLSGGFLSLTAAFVSPLYTNPTQHVLAWAIAAGAAFVAVVGWRRSKHWNPGDYA